MVIDHPDPEARFTHAYLAKEKVEQARRLIDEGRIDEASALLDQAIVEMNELTGPGIP